MTSKDISHSLNDLDMTGITNIITENELRALRANDQMINYVSVKWSFNDRIVVQDGDHILVFTTFNQKGGCGVFALATYVINKRIYTCRAIMSTEAINSNKFPDSFEDLIKWARRTIESNDIFHTFIKMVMEDCTSVKAEFDYEDDSIYEASIRFKQLEGEYKRLFGDTISETQKKAFATDIYKDDPIWDFENDILSIAEMEAAVDKVHEKK